MSKLDSEYMGFVSAVVRKPSSRAVITKACEGLTLVGGPRFKLRRAGRLCSAHSYCTLEAATYRPPPPSTFGNLQPIPANDDIRRSRRVLVDHSFNNLDPARSFTLLVRFMQRRAVGEPANSNIPTCQCF